LTAMAAWILPFLVHVTDPSDRLEIARIALTVGAGTGGVVALVLAGRRQWSTEQAHKATEHDAAERRITELYTKAVDQLGADQAAVRLGGLYALERLANTTTTQQGTIANVICAYLRMPYNSPPTLASDANEDDRKERDRLIQEQETRSAALEILVRHGGRGYPEEDRWPGLWFRLQRASLINADLIEANLDSADLSGADLTGAILHNAYLGDANLSGGTNLRRADLSYADLGCADLSNAILTDSDLRNANLRRADLRGADLRGADLTNANVSEACLTDDQWHAAWGGAKDQADGIPG
jgi:hypothetical protein